jgi:uncharacterized CHY-type Zn-finger protein
VKIHDATVMGVDVDPQTRCAHYHDERDFIAIKFKCCGNWFSCHQCHATLAGHPPEVWSKDEFGERAVLCGNCREQLTIREYLKCESVCPHCQRQFNPGCARHHHLYFEM